MTNPTPTDPQQPATGELLPGWTFKKMDDKIAVWKDGFGGYVARRASSITIAIDVLHELATDIMASRGQRPASQPIDGDCIASVAASRGRQPASRAMKTEADARADGLRDLRKVLLAQLADVDQELAACGAPVPREGAGPVADQWVVIGPDGSRFVGETPHRAANAANRDRVKADLKLAAEFEAIQRRWREESDRENERLLAEHGTLNCLACGGSGHVGDAPSAQGAYPLPDDLYPGSKDWIAGDYAARVGWLHSMYESARQEADMWCEQAGKAQGAGARDAVDAARYRWLRDEAINYDTTETAAPWCVFGRFSSDCEPTQGEGLDAAIDAARAAGGEAKS